MPLGSEFAPYRGTNVFSLNVYSEKLKKLLLNITTKALIFGIKHRLEHLYQYCSNYAFKGQNWPNPEGKYVFLYVYCKNSFLETTMPRAWIFAFKHGLMDPYNM